MRLAYLVTGYPLPSHTFVQKEVLGLREGGVEVHTFAPVRSGPEAVLSEADRRELETTYSWRPVRPAHHLRAHLAALVRRRGGYGRAIRSTWARRGPGLRSKLYRFLYLAQAVVLWHRCTLARVRHVHVHFANSSSDIAMLATELGGPGWSWSLAMHGPTEFFDVERLQLADKAEHAAFVVCISEFSRSQLMAFTDSTAWERFRIVHCGVDLEELRPAAEPAGTPPAGPLEVVCVGRLVDVKGQRILLEAAAALRAEHGLDLRVTLVGDGPTRPTLERRAVELGLDGAVSFTGALGHPEALERVRGADLFCLPSFAEGVPVSLMEAMALGVPVVSTHITGIPELIRDGESGVLVVPGNVASLAAALRRVAQDPELRARLARGGREAVERGFDLRRTVAELQGVFDEYLAPA